MAKQMQSWKGFVIVLAILAAIVGGIFVLGKLKTPQSPYETLYYNNFEFQKIENVWYTHIQRDEQLYNVVRGLGGEMVSACAKNLTEACENRPIVTCDNDDLAVVHLRIRNETRVRLEGNCLVIEGTELDLIRATDRVLYHFYKIMP